jgi:catechol 2,3-dioxygenase-like lactoylglutathione lyase family enzyme
MTNTPRLRVLGVCLDCADARELADFYAHLLGWPITASDDEGWYHLSDPAGSIGLNVQAEDWYEPPVWPEQPGAQHKMLHFEIQVEDMDAALAHAIASGARVAPHQPPDRDPSQLRVMLDPAGHPFCLCTD